MHTHAHTHTHTHTHTLYILYLMIHLSAYMKLKKRLPSNNPEKGLIGRWRERGREERIVIFL